MREILFRGKRLPDGEWVYGDYTSYCRLDRIYAHDELQKIVWFVDGSTVSRFTGLTDKNGMKIFEDDIVRLTGNPDDVNTRLIDYNALVIFSNGGFCAVDGTPDNYWLKRYSFARCELNCEVIGNIHDNPELLKGD